MNQTTKVEDQKEQKTYTAEEFAKAYQKLSEEMGWRIVVNPAYFARDDGSWSTILQMSVGALPKELTK